MTLSGIIVNAWIAFFACALAASPILRLLRKLKSRQTIYEHAPQTHQVKQGTPTMGGLMILFGTTAGMLAWANGAPQRVHELYAVAILLGGFALIGFADDFIVPRLMPGKRGLGWKQKLFAEVALAVGAVWVAGWLGQPGGWVAVFSILFFANAYNFADGLDGLAGTILIGFCFALACMGWMATQETTVNVSLILIAATVPFLFVNAPPARVFMGDVGALPIGAILGWLWCLLAYRNGPGGMIDMAMASALGIASIILILELILVPIQVAYYKRTKKRLFPMTPIHHAFEKKGWPESRVVWTFALSQIVISAVAVSLYYASVNPGAKVLMEREALGVDQ